MINISGAGNWRTIAQTTKLTDKLLLRFFGLVYYSQPFSIIYVYIKIAYSILPWEVTSKIDANEVKLIPGFNIKLSDTLYVFH